MMSRQRRANQPAAASAAVAMPSRGKLWIIALLATVALALSGYLLWGAWGGDALPGCGPASGCNTVLNSRWGYWLGIPVSLGALAVYVAVMVILVRLSRPLPAPVRVWYGAGLLALAGVVLGAAVWFIGLQFFVIGAICPYCMTAHVCGGVMATLILLSSRSWLTPRGANAGLHESGRGRARLRPRRCPPDLAPAGREARPTGVMATEAVGKEEHTSRKPGAGPGRGWPALAVAAALAVLVVGQVIYRPPAFVVQTSSRSAPAGVGAARPGPVLDLHGGEFRLDLREVPLLGPPDAPHVLVSLFDYTCRHCRAAHLPLVETQRAFSNHLALVSLPVPLDRACNPTVRRPLPAHTNACVYARLGLAVWRANRLQSPAFDDWLFATPSPPTTQAAYAEASRLVGTNALAQALQDRWVDDLLAQDVRLHRTNQARFGKGQLPQLLLGPNLAVGAFDSTPALLQLVGQQFGLAIPSPAGTNGPAR